MKRILIVIALFLPIIANAQGFRLGTSAGMSRVGYTATENAEGSMHLDFSVTPDWRFAPNWGALADVSIGTAIIGSGESDGIHTLQAKIALAPYWEQQYEQWYIDVLAGVFVRARFPFFGATPMRMGLTVSAGPSAGIRAGYFLNERIDVFGMLRLERSLFDPLADTTSPYLTDYRAGTIALSFGLRFKL